MWPNRREQAGQGHAPEIYISLDHSQPSPTRQLLLLLPLPLPPLLLLPLLLLLHDVPSLSSFSHSLALTVGRRLAGQVKAAIFRCAAAAAAAAAVAAAVATVAAAFAVTAEFR